MIEKKEGKWPTAMKAFKRNRIDHYKAGIKRREKLIEKRNRLNKADELAIRHLKHLIKIKEAKKDE